MASNFGFAFPSGYVPSLPFLDHRLILVEFLHLGLPSGSNPSQTSSSRLLWGFHLKHVPQIILSHIAVAWVRYSFCVANFLGSCMCTLIAVWRVSSSVISSLALKTPISLSGGNIWPNQIRLLFHKLPSNRTKPLSMLACLLQLLTDMMHWLHPAAHWHINFLFFSYTRHSRQDCAPFWK